MNKGRQIKVYLDDGSVTGIRHAEIVNWTGQALAVPRNKVKSLPDWQESTKPGVYFLMGIDEASGDSAVYIGEAENVCKRIQQHLANTNKDFWSEVVIFTSKDENLTKSHVKYLESRLIQISKIANRYVLLNGNEPQVPSLPRGDRDAMEEFIHNLKVLLGVIGHKALEPLVDKFETCLPKELADTQPTTTHDNEFFLNVKGLNAKSLITDEGIVVLAGSDVSTILKDSLSTGYKKLREQLIATRTITDVNGKFQFSKNHLFTSPSQAAAIIVGYAINGRNAWQNSDGKTIKEIENG